MLSGINDLIHWSEGGLSSCVLFALTWRDVKAASTILATLISLERNNCTYNSVIFFLIQCLNIFKLSHLLGKDTIIFRHVLSNVKRK